jgi:hypothetical protein
VGLPWGAALLVGLVSVLYAKWSTDASNAFIGWIAGRTWLAFVITPALTVLALYLTRRWFAGSEGSGIPQVIAALHAPRAEEDTLMRRLFGLRVIVGKICISLIGLLGGLTIGREGPTVHIGAAIMAEIRYFYPHHTAQLERRLLLAGAAAGLSVAFNTPLAGIIFAIEELARDFESRTNGIMITAVVFSGLTSLALAGNYLYFGQINVSGKLGAAFILPGRILGDALWALRCGVQSRIAAVANMDAGMAGRAACAQAVAVCPGHRDGGGCARRRHARRDLGQRLRSGTPSADWRRAALCRLCDYPMGRHGSDVHGRHTGRTFLTVTVDRRRPCAVGTRSIHLGAHGGRDRALYDGISRCGDAITYHIVRHRDGDDKRHRHGDSDDGDRARGLAHFGIFHTAPLRGPRAEQLLPRGPRCRCGRGRRMMRDSRWLTGKILH